MGWVHSAFFYALYLFTKLCTPKQNLSKYVNVVCDGSPSRIRSILLISLGITTLPKSSILLTKPLAVPKIVRRSCSSLTILTATLPYARCIVHRTRSRRHQLLSYIHFSLIYKLCCYYLYFWEKYTARFTFETEYAI